MRKQNVLMDTTDHMLNQSVREKTPMIFYFQNKLSVALSKCAYQLLVLSVTLLFAAPTKAKANSIDTVLKKQLDSIGLLDQKYRLLTENFTATSADSLSRVYHIIPDSVYDHLLALQGIVDSTNIAFVAQVIARYGYPGKTLVGDPTNHVAFSVIQHSSYIPLYLPVLRDAARKKELPYPLVAMMEDRMLTESEQEQIYGTQVWGNAVKDSIMGVTKPQFYFNPIRDPAHVNKRRRDAGFTTTIQQYALELGVQYRIKTPWWWKKK